MTLAARSIIYHYSDVICSLPDAIGKRLLESLEIFLAATQNYEINRNNVQKICQYLESKGYISKECIRFLYALQRQNRLMWLNQIIQRARHSKSPYVYVSVLVSHNNVYSDKERLTNVLTRCLGEEVIIASLSVDHRLSGGLVILWKNYRLNLSANQFFKKLRKEIGL